MKQLLVVAGLDPSGGAGLLADARVATELGVRTVGVVSALTVQDTRGVVAANPVDAAFVAAQLERLLDDVRPDAVKLGMLGSVAIARAVAAALTRTSAPIVWDPVLRPTRGGVSLLEGGPAEAARLLLGRVRVVTPNLNEAAVLAGEASPPADVGSMRRVAATLRSVGAAAVLVKGGHLAGDRAVDVLHDGDEVFELGDSRLATPPLHGTGCTLSTAIASRLALGDSLVAAVRFARVFLRQKLAAPVSPGGGASSPV